MQPDQVQQRILGTIILPMGQNAIPASFRRGQAKRMPTGYHHDDGGDPPAKRHPQAPRTSHKRFSMDIPIRLTASLAQVVK